MSGAEREPGALGPDEREAVVTGLMPHGLCRVELADGAGVGRVVLAHSAPAAAANFVRLRPGDRVLVVLSPQDPSRGRVVRVLRTV